MNTLFALITLTIGIASIAAGAYLGWFLVLLASVAIIGQIYEALPFVKKKKETSFNDFSSYDFPSLFDDLNYMKQVRAHPTTVALREIYFNKRMKKLLSTADIKNYLVLRIIHATDVVEQIKALIEEARNSCEWKILDDLENTNENEEDTILDFSRIS